MTHPTQMRRLSALSIAVACALLSWARPAEAGAINIFQEWRDPLYAIHGQWFTTSSNLDDGGLTGSGTEKILLTSMSMVEWLGIPPAQVGQNAYSAAFSCSRLKTPFTYSA